MRAIAALTDLTSSGDHAIRLAVEMAQASGAELSVVHGMELVGLTLREAFEPLHSGRIPAPHDVLDAQIRRCAGPIAHAVSPILDGRGGARVVTELVAGGKADLAVVGRNGADRTDAADPLSTGLEIANAAGIPVLVTGGALRWPPRKVSYLTKMMGTDAAAEIFDGITVQVAGKSSAGMGRTDLLLAVGTVSELEGQLRDMAGSEWETDLLLMPVVDGEESRAAQPPPSAEIEPGSSIISATALAS